MTIKELIASGDIKGESMEINAVENGFLGKFSYRTKPKKETETYWDYSSKTFAFTDWTDVVEWVKNNTLPQPPK